MYFFFIFLVISEAIMVSWNQSCPLNYSVIITKSLNKPETPNFPYFMFSVFPKATLKEDI